MHLILTHSWMFSIYILCNVYLHSQVPMYVVHVITFTTPITFRVLCALWKTPKKYEVVLFRKRLKRYGDKRFNPLNTVEKNDVGYQISSFCWVTVKMHFADFSGMSSNWFKVMQELGIILSTGTKTTFHLTFVAIHPCL